MLKKLYDGHVRSINKNFLEAVEGFENIAEGGVRPQFIRIPADARKNQRSIDPTVIRSAVRGLLLLSTDGSPMALGLGRGPCGSGDAGDPEPRPNPASGGTASGETLRRHGPV